MHSIDPRLVHVEQVMGTAVSFDLRGAGAHPAAIAEAVGWLHEVDARFSPYRDDSEVRRFDRGGPVSAELEEILAVCDAVRDASGGAFDARLPTGFDPSAYVKGWSAQRAGEILRHHGCDHWSINAGGDVLVTSPGPDPVPWRIGVRHPEDAASVAFVLEASDLAVATSGHYERGVHLLDPRTGEPATGAVSTTVCGPDLGLADAIATAAFVLGAEGPGWVAQVPGYECWSVLDGGQVLATSGFPRMAHGVPVRTSGIRA